MLVFVNYLKHALIYSCRIFIVKFGISENDVRKNKNGHYTKD